MQIGQAERSGAEVPNGVFRHCVLGMSWYHRSRNSRQIWSMLLFLDGPMCQTWSMFFNLCYCIFRWIYVFRSVCFFNLCFPLALLANGIHSTKNILVDYQSFLNTPKNLSKAHLIFFPKNGPSRRQLDWVNEGCRVAKTLVSSQWVNLFILLKGALGHPKRKLVFQPSIFRCKLAVSFGFRACPSLSNSLHFCFGRVSEPARWPSWGWSWRSYKDKVGKSSGKSTCLVSSSPHPSLVHRLHNVEAVYSSMWAVSRSKGQETMWY